MLTCPKCRNKIPAWKLLFLTNFNTITCPTCSTRLQLNKKISRLIGGIGGGLGGGIGALLLISWMETKRNVLHHADCSPSYTPLFRKLVGRNQIHET